MRTLTQADFLALWETGRSLHPLDRGLLAVSAAFPEAQDDSAADWPLGRLNRSLAEMRQAYFGSTLGGWTTCAVCGEKLEFEVDCGNLAAEPPSCEAAPITLLGKSFRRVTSRDLAAIAAEADPDTATLRLAARCVLEPEGTPAAALALTGEDLDELGRRMAEADPLAEILLSFECPECGHVFKEEMDLPSFLWAEIEGTAKRVLGQVHRLAQAYGWNEEEILSLSESRRSLYLEMVNA